MVLRDVANDYHNWVTSSAQKWDVEIVDPPEGRRDDFVEPCFRQAQPGNRDPTKCVHRWENRGVMMLRPVSLVCAAFAFGPLASPVLPQLAIPVGESAPLLAPAIDRDGRILAFGAAVNSDGTIRNVPDLWIWNAANNAARRLTNYASTGGSYAVTSFALSADGSQVAYVASALGGQVGEIHVIGAASGSDRLLASDKQGCVQPMVVCPACFFPCVHDPRFTADGRILYATSRSQPFYLASADGTVTPLPVYSGYLASGPRRVVSDNGLVVFVSSAPSSPTNAAAPLNVYLVNLDGSGLRNLTQFSSVNVYVQDAVISADGGMIAFAGNGGSTDASAPLRIFTIKADGTGLRQLTSETDYAYNPSLSGDGSLVAFVQSGQIKVLPTGGGSPASSLTSFRYSTAQDAFISDDASQVAFTIGPKGGRGAIYEASVSGGASHAVYAPVSLNSGGVLGVAGWETPSPGSLISLYGLNFSGDEAVVASSFPLLATLDNVSLLVNGEAVPVEAVTPWQINAQLPQNTPPGSVTFQVVSNGVSSNAVTEQILSSAASVFGFPEQGAQAGTVYWQAAAFHAGTGTPADLTHPAAAGEILETYGSGLGQTNPTVPAGEPSPASPLAWAIVIPQVTIGSQPAQVAFVGLVPGLAGVYQINVAVPDGLTPGQQSLNWTYDNRGASIFVK